MLNPRSIWEFEFGSFNSKIQYRSFNSGVFNPTIRLCLPLRDRNRSFNSGILIPILNIEVMIREYSIQRSGFACHCVIEIGVLIRSAQSTIDTGVLIRECSIPANKNFILYFYILYSVFICFFLSSSLQIIEQFLFLILLKVQVQFEY